MLKEKAVKILSIIISIVFVMVMLTGCGSGNQPEQQQTITAEQTTTTAQQAVTEAPKKVDTIKVWTNRGHTKDLFPQIVQQYNDTVGKEKGIIIDYSVPAVSGDYIKAVDLALAGGTAPEIFTVQGDMNAYIAKGSVLAIDDLPGGKELLDSYKGYLAPGINTFNGKTYALPCSVYSMGLAFNKDLFKKAGIVDEKGDAKPPKTWAEVAEDAKKITNQADKVYGIVLPMKYAGFFRWNLLFNFIPSIGHNYWVNKEGKFNFSSFKPALEWLIQIKNDNSYFPGPEGLDVDPARAQFSEGRVGMYMSASWDVAVFNDQFPAKCDWGIAPLPVIDLSAPRYRQFMSLSHFTSIGTSAIKSNMEKVFEVYKWLNSDEVFAKTYEEGKDIPYKADIAKLAQKEPEKNGWKEFADLVAISKGLTLEPAVETEGGLDYRQELMKIWMDPKSMDEILANLDKVYNAALEQAVADGKVRLIDYTDPNLDMTLPK